MSRFHWWQHHTPGARRAYAVPVRWHSIALFALLIVLQCSTRYVVSLEVLWAQSLFLG